MVLEVVEGEKYTKYSRRFTWWIKQATDIKAPIKTLENRNILYMEVGPGFRGSDNLGSRGKNIEAEKGGCSGSVSLCGI